MSLLAVHLTEGQPDPKPHPWRIHLTRDQSDQSSNTLGHKMSLLAVHLTQGGTSDQRSAWPKDLTKMSTWPEASPTGGYIWPEVNLTKVVTHMATRCLCWQYIWKKVSLTQSLAKCQPEPKPHLWGGPSDQRSDWLKDLSKMSTWPEASTMGWYIWLSAKTTSENWNTLCI